MTLIRSDGPNKGYIDFNPSTGELEIHLKPDPPRENYFDNQLAVNTELQQELKSANHNISVYQQEARDKTAALQHAEEDIERLKEKNKDLTLELNGTRQLKLSYSLQVTHLNTELNKAIEAKRQFRRENHRLRSEARELRNQILDLTSRLGEYLWKV